MLIVVENRNFHGFLECFFYIKAFRSFNVFQIDAAEGRFQQLACLDNFIRVFRVEFYVKHVDVGKTFKKNPFPFHDRLTRQGSKIAETQYGGTVGYNRNQVALSGVFVGILRIFLNRKTGLGNAG